MMRGVYGNDQRYRAAYWGMWGGKYFYTSDAAIVDDEGYFWIIGRLDDVVNVAGHRISTAEIEGVAIEHNGVAESAFIGAHHHYKGQAIIGFIVLKQGVVGSQVIKQEINELIGNKIGKFQVPEKIVFVKELPKTRTAKIMRRVLRDIAESRIVSDRSTLVDPGVIEQITKDFRSGN